MSQGPVVAALTCFFSFFLVLVSFYLVYSIMHGNRYREICLLYSINWPIIHVQPNEKEVSMSNLGRTLAPCIDDVAIRNILGGTSTCPSKDTNELEFVKVCGSCTVYAFVYVLPQLALSTCERCVARTQTHIRSYHTPSYPANPTFFLPSFLLLFSSS
jgi:hypothetical protein